MSYPESPNPITGKAPKHVAAAIKTIKSETNITPNLIKDWLDDIEAEISTITDVQSAKKLKNQFRSEWQNEYNVMFEQLSNIQQEKLTPRLISMPKKLQTKINELDT